VGLRSQWDYVRSVNRAFVNRAFVNGAFWTIMSTSSRSADLASDVFSQAQSGSITAIIQILNEDLADVGVRTRAVLEGTVLELLCEASQGGELAEASLVPRIVHLLEGIAPPNIRRVNFYGRIIREQQLLWLDEIRRDPDSLLWSQSMRLTRPNPVMRLWQNSRRVQARPIAFPTMSSGQPEPRKSRLWYGLAGGAGVALALIALGAFLSEWLQTPSAIVMQGNPRVENPAATNPPAANPPTAKSGIVAPGPIIGANSGNALKTTPKTGAKPEASKPEVSGTIADPFAEAVRVAEQASVLGKIAKTSAQRLEQATLWRRASELMEQVPATDARYETARDRVGAYRKNSDAAIDRTKGP
jgi:hypothetical protein